MKETLEEKIARRDTELQRVFDRATANKKTAAFNLQQAQYELDCAEQDLARITARAAELGMSHIL